PRYEAVMAAAGPATSLLLGALLLALGWLPVSPDARFGLYYLARLNIVLALFNLLPAFPMDGGRVLRALLAARLGMPRATQIAAKIGKAMSLLFAVVGILGGNFILMLIALFLYGGADFEGRAYQLRESLAGVPLRDIMATPVPSIAIEASLAEA